MGGVSMAFDWKRELETGIPEIDIQHRQIFTRANDLLEQMKLGKGKREVARVLGFLGTYTEEHFVTEERYMRQYGYPNAVLHGQLHDEFRLVLSELQARLRDEGISTSLVLDTQKTIHDWWRSHIVDKDTVLAEFLRERIAAEQKKAG